MHHVDTRTTAIIVKITPPPPSVHAQMMFVTVLVLCVLGELGLMQSSSVSDFTFVGQVGSTVYIVPATVRGEPLLTHDEKTVTRSSAEYVPTGLV